MAFGKTAGCIILMGAAIASAAQFPVRHEHWHDHCNGVLTVDEQGVSFAGPKKHAWSWKYQDLQQLRLAPDGIYLLTYRDNKLLLGADRGYRFTGHLPAEQLYALLKDRLDQRFIAALSPADQATDLPAWTFSVKHLGRITGSEGMLTFSPDAVVYSTNGREESRTWRYQDLDNISSSGPFELTITTFERGRTQFNFQLKQPITEATYTELWLQVEKKNGKLQ